MKAVTWSRMGRGNFVFGALGLAIAWAVAQYLVTGAINPMLELGSKFRPEALRGGAADLALVALALDAGLLWFVVRRLHDAGLTGWWSLALIAAPFLSPAGSVLVLGGLIVLVALPGQIGPNPFGPDPRGWTSKAQYEQQQQRLKSGDI